MAPAHPSLIVLVIEDDDAIRRLVSDTLAGEGLLVKEAADGYAAVELARADRPDLVVLDIMLPGLDGLTVAEQLRQLYGDELPILVMTAGQKIAEHAAQVGAYSQLDKPFDLDHLVIAVRRGLISSVAYGADVRTEDVAPATALEGQAAD